MSTSLYDLIDAILMQGGLILTGLSMSISKEIFNGWLDNGNNH